jgi:cardiolipin synthase
MVPLLPGWASKLFVAATTVAILVAVGLAIAQDQVVLRLRSATAATDPHAPAYVAALVGAGLSHGNSFEVLVNGDEILPAMLAAIENARRRISLETYVYEVGEVAERFTAALERAARRGVVVNVVLDSIGTAGMDPEHVERLRRAGCHVVNFNPTHWYTLEELNYRTHRKILVVDGDVGFTGGAGVADYWLGDAENEHQWRETHVRIRGPIVRLLEAAFYENLLEGGDVVTPALDEAPQGTGDNGASLLVRSSPSGGSSDMKRLYLLSFAMARRSIDLASPYVIPDESTLWAFEDAVTRGVRIRILAEGDVTDAKPVKFASRAFYEQLLELGVEIYEYEPTMMHAKVLVVDGVWSVFGSANFDNRSLELNDELNVAVSSASLAAQLLDDFERDLHMSRRLELRAWRERSPLEQAREHFWSYFGEVF